MLTGQKEEPGRAAVYCRVSSDEQAEVVKLELDLALKAGIEAQLNHDQQTPHTTSISTHLAAAEAALQGPTSPPSTAPANHERPPASAARPAGMRIG